MDVHRAEFARAEKPVAPPFGPVDIEEFLDVREKESLRGVPVWKFAERKVARARATELAAHDAQQEQERRARENEEKQRALDQGWESLLANDQSTVIEVIDDAFEDNKAPAAPVNVEGSTLSLVMLAPGKDEIPDKKPALTPSGNPTVKKMTKTEYAEGYLTLVCGHLLATIKEALAVAPGISDVKAVVVRRSEPDVYGQVHFEALIAGTYPRTNLERVDWKHAEAPDVAQQAADAFMWDLRGRPPELTALSLDDEPDLKVFINALAEEEE